LVEGEDLVDDRLLSGARLPRLKVGHCAFCDTCCEVWKAFEHCKDKSIYRESFAARWYLLRTRSMTRRDIQ
jgi:hypothetical protein